MKESGENLFNCVYNGDPSMISLILSELWTLMLHNADWMLSNQFVSNMPKEGTLQFTFASDKSNQVNWELRRDVCKQVLAGQSAICVWEQNKEFFSRVKEVDSIDPVIQRRRGPIPGHAIPHFD